MKQDQAYQKDLESIRELMERSVKFISLSGLSGIMAGLYALFGSTIGYYLIHNRDSSYDEGKNEILPQLIALAAVVFVSSIATGFWLSSNKAKKAGVEVWNSTSKRLILNLSIPLVAGGFFILILLSHGRFELAVPASLIFYGLALINASPNLYEEVRYLGYLEIILGLVSAMIPGYGLLFWAIGFGVLHIVYGAIMYKRYDL
jgi:hypothetical protein